MPPRGSSKKIKEKESAPIQQELPSSAPLSGQKRQLKFLKMYRSFYCGTNQPGFFNANYSYLRKIGAHQKHRIDRYYLRMERNTFFEDKLLVFKHMEKYKRLRHISFYMGQKVINQGIRLQQQVEILRRFSKSLRRFTHLSKIEFIYPNKLQDLLSLKHIGHLDHITLGLDIADFLKDENEKRLIALLTRHFQNHRFQSAKLICYGAGGGGKKGKKGSKKGGKGKAKKGKGKGKGKVVEEEEDELPTPAECLSNDYNRLTNLTSLSLEAKENSVCKALRHLVIEGVFPHLKSFSFLGPDGGVTIQDKTKNISNLIIDFLVFMETGDIPKKKLDNSKSTEVLIKNYEPWLKTSIEEIANFGNIRQLAIVIAKTKDKELRTLFQTVTNLKKLSFQFSPQSDAQVKEFYEGVKGINKLSELELYFQNYTFSQDGVKGIYDAINKHSPHLTKFCIGFNEVDNINNTAMVMGHALQMPNLAIFKLYLGYSGPLKNLEVLKHLREIKNLTEFEFAAFFNSISVPKVGELFRDSLNNVNTLRSLSLKVVWHYNMWDGMYRKEDFTNILGEVPNLRRLNEFYVDFENSTWHKVKPK